MKGNVNLIMFFEVLMAKIILSNVKENPQNEGEQKDMGRDTSKSESQTGHRQGPKVNISNSLQDGQKNELIAGRDVKANLKLQAHVHLCS